MEMPERTKSGDGYRYGFNGKEQDASISSTTDYDYGFRVYNPELGRFLSVDPLTKSYPSSTPYSFAMNRPIDGIDLDGKEWWQVFAPADGIGQTVLKNEYARDVAEGFYERAKGTAMGIWNVITGKGNGGEPGGAQRIIGSLHTGIFNDYENWGDNRFAAQLIINYLDAVINDYADLIGKTFEGNGKAAGGLLFEAFIFFLPEAKGAFVVKTAEEGATALDFAVDAIQNGQRNFENATLEEVTVTAGQPDKIIAGTGEYRAVGGHHIHAKAGFADHMAYDPKRGFSISQKLMKEYGIDHNLITTTQRKLFRELAESGRPNTLLEHSRIAKESLIAGGASKELAEQLVNLSLDNLSHQNVTIPTHIPWNKPK